MSDEEKANVEDVRKGLVHLAEVAKEADQPLRAILNTQIFLLIKKVDFALGAKP